MTETHVTLAAAFEGITRGSGLPRRPSQVEQLEPLISAALLTSTAFRLRDRAALDEALRLLVRATDEVERTVLQSAS